MRQGTNNQRQVTRNMGQGIRPCLLSLVPRFFSVLLVSCLLSLVAIPAAAASLYFTVPKDIVFVGEDFEVLLMLDTEG